MLNAFYRETYPESFESSLSPEVTYIGPYRFKDEVQFEYNGEQQTSTVGDLLLSPTRTFAPLVRELLDSAFEKIHGMIHCSGGGQTKCLKYLPRPFRIIKDNLFTPPVIFELIQKASGADDKEMYQVFNMGTRLEIYAEENAATEIISMANSFGIEARVIGRVEASDKRELIIGKDNVIRY